MSNSNQIHVPRFSEITGHKPVEDLRVERDHDKLRGLFRADSVRYGFGTQEGKSAWRRRIEKTRSF